MSAQNIHHPFQDYWKIGLNANTMWRSAENQDNPINWELLDNRNKNIGLKWNFYQFNDRYNLSLSLNHFNLYDDYRYTVKKEDFYEEAIPEDFVMEAKFTSTSLERLQLGIMVDRYQTINENLNWSIGIGPQVFYISNIDKRSGSMGYEYDGSYYKVFMFKREGNDFQFGLKGRLALGIKSKIGLFEVEGNSNLGFYNFTDYFVRTIDLAESEASYSKHSLKSSYFGLGISYYPKRNKKK